MFLLPFIVGGLLIGFGISLTPDHLILGSVMTMLGGFAAGMVTMSLIRPSAEEVRRSLGEPPSMVADISDEEIEQHGI